MKRKQPTTIKRWTCTDDPLEFWYEMTGKGMFDYGVLINTCGPKERKQCREENKDRKREKKDMIKRYKKREIVFANSEEMREFDMCIDSINDEIERCKKCRPYVIAAIFPPKE